MDSAVNKMLQCVIMKLLKSKAESQDSRYIFSDLVHNSCNKENFLGCESLTANLPDSLQCFSKSHGMSKYTSKPWARLEPRHRLNNVVVQEPDTTNLRTEDYCY